MLHRPDGRRFVTLAAVALLALGSSCAGGPSSGPDSVAPADRADGDIVVSVTNNTLARLRIHAMYDDAEPMVLGEVSTYRTRSFAFPWKEGKLKIGVRRSDSTEPTPRWSPTSLEVVPGDSLEFTLTANARRTAQIVFRKVGG